MNINNPESQGLPLYTAEQVRELDRLAIEEAGIPGYALMSRAGEACWGRLGARWPAARSIVVVCGTGNNGGDGYIVARLARAAGLQVRLVQIGDEDRIRGDALTARTDYVGANGTIMPFSADALAGADVIIDALLGTGLQRELEGTWRDAVDAINASGIPVLAIDIPSGLHADSGSVMGVAVRAAETVTFIGRKRGLYTGQGQDYAGSVSFSDLGVPATVYKRVASSCRLVEQPLLGPLAGPRSRGAHKGDFGHVLVLGGGPGMAGAVRLAGEAALRTGAGLVSLATHPEHATVLAAACPELIAHTVASPLELRDLMKRATVVVAGPGLGQSAWAQSLLPVVLESRRPQVLDADALNLLAREPLRCDNRVLTPHPGEAGRLLRQSTGEIQADRFAAVSALNQQYGGVAVLKGAGTIIHAGDRGLSVCKKGNPGMATAGMGDVLSGVIAALIAQGMPLADAAVAGVCVHASAGDRAALRGERGMTAGDVIAELRSIMNPAGELA
jgi:NAD(P)H-hydrate epimerase